MSLNMYWLVHTSTLALLGCTGAVEDSAAVVPSESAVDEPADTGVVPLAEARLQRVVELLPLFAGPAPADAVAQAWAVAESLCGGPAVLGGHATELDCETEQGGVEASRQRKVTEDEQQTSAEAITSVEVERSEGAWHLDAVVRQQWGNQGEFVGWYWVDLTSPRGARLPWGPGPVDMLIQVEQVPELEGERIQFDGQASFPPVDGIAAFALTGLGLTDESCPEPAGSLGFRDEQGTWYYADFDGPSAMRTDTAEPSCDGCGVLRRFATELGEVCVDFEDLRGRTW